MKFPRNKHSDQEMKNPTTEIYSDCFSSAEAISSRSAKATRENFTPILTDYSPNANIQSKRNIWVRHQLIKGHEKNIKFPEEYPKEIGV